MCDRGCSEYSGNWDDNERDVYGDAFRFAGYESVGDACNGDYGDDYGSRSYEQR
jgi:hypothetical protein